MLENPEEFIRQIFMSSTVDSNHCSNYTGWDQQCTTITTTPQYNTEFWNTSNEQQVLLVANQKGMYKTSNKRYYRRREDLEVTEGK